MRKFLAVFLIVILPSTIAHTQRAMFFGQNTSVSGNTFPTGAVAIFDASNGGITCSSGGGTTNHTWTDASGNGHTLTAQVSDQSCISNVIGTNSAVVFGGADYFKMASAAGCTDPCTFYAVIIPVFAPTANRSIVGSDTNDTNSANWQVPDSTAVMQFDQNFTANLGQSTTTLVTNTQIEVAVTIVGGVITFHRNGTLDTCVGSCSGGSITQAPNLIGLEWHGSPDTFFVGQLLMFVIDAHAYNTNAHTYFTGRGFV